MNRQEEEEEEESFNDTTTRSSTMMVVDESGTVGDGAAKSRNITKNASSSRRKILHVSLFWLMAGGILAFVSGVGMGFLLGSGASNKETQSEVAQLSRAGSCPCPPSPTTSSMPTLSPTSSPAEKEPTTTIHPHGSDWAFLETFDGDPDSPSQDLLPAGMEYVVTHRTHPQEHFTKAFPLYLADHDHTCRGPDPTVTPLPQHWVQTSQDSSNGAIDESFFVCKHHMMSSMGEVEGYSVSAFWPRQEFQFVVMPTIK